MLQWFLATCITKIHNPHPNVLRIGQRHTCVSTKGRNFALSSQRDAFSVYIELGSSIFPHKRVFGNERRNGRFISFSKKIDIGRFNATEIFYVKVPDWQSKTKLLIKMPPWLLSLSVGQVESYKFAYAIFNKLQTGRVSFWTRSTLYILQEKPNLFCSRLARNLVSRMYALTLAFAFGKQL